MEVKNVHSAVARLIEHVKLVQPGEGIAFPTLPTGWLAEFLRKDAAVEQLCVNAQIEIPSGQNESDNIVEEARLSSEVWQYCGKTGLRVLRTWKSDGEPMTLAANSRSWLQRMELVRIKAEVVAGPESLAPTAGSDRRCRLRAEDTIDGCFIHLDGKPYPANEGAVKLFQAAIEAGGDYVSMTETGCKSRQLDKLPPALLRLLDRDPAKGTRLLRSAWLD